MRGSAWAVALALAAVIIGLPAGQATKVLVFSKTYVVNGVANTNDPFYMPDPGGASPAACYVRSFSGFPTGAMVIRVLDHHGNTVFVDEMVGTPIVGGGTPVGLFGVIPGTWRVTVQAAGFFPGVTVNLWAASSPGEC